MEGRWIRELRALIKKNGALFRAQKFIRACMYSMAWMPHVRTRFGHRFLYGLIGLLTVPIGFINYLFSPAVTKVPPKGLAVVAIVKNEARYIQEWIEFYLLSGVDKIIIFDNGSTDETAELVKQMGGGGLLFLPWESPSIRCV